MSDDGQTNSDPEIVHIAGLAVHVDHRVRQRCAWCAALLDDSDLRLIGMPIEDVDKPYPTWEVGALVAQAGPVSWVMPYNDGDKLPPQCCAMIDPTVTA